ncbi:hypothetical protein ACFQI7_23685 [Paenibacillus allorhizosphaerae]|uniref:Uncharacterized protein n=1 Tax=Paenibacillus allorhizosphaerae TaxID=2849866 RepID=A0ABM8VKG4_9BACL|nr:hypothetical protein [Paenibacillus allorhizosphaerae]CAG7646410.1 hypothetical protein PAECIP111802_03737 [Paenibacillus allorhizosphaerae]
MEDQEDKRTVTDLFVEDYEEFLEEEERWQPNALEHLRRKKIRYPKRRSKEGTDR